MPKEQMVEKERATSELNQLGQRILQRKEFLEGTNTIQKQGGSSTSDSHFKLV